ncbi:MAG TPA: hydrolase [Balneolales bacterium]|nr:hydrolase [Balneolales bacterium]
MADLTLNPDSTALVLIDLQKGIVSRDVAPHSSSEVVDNAAKLVHKCHDKGVAVILVRVSFAKDGRDRLSPKAEVEWSGQQIPKDFDQLVPEISPDKADHIITKRQWGAFYGTDLDLQLRRRGIDTLLMGGISTNIGVESTARNAYERGYNQVLVEDAMSSMSADAHEFAISNIFPRIGLIRSTSEVLKVLN